MLLMGKVDCRLRAVTKHRRGGLWWWRVDSLSGQRTEHCVPALDHSASKDTGSHCRPLHTPGTAQTPADGSNSSQNHHTHRPMYCGWRHHHLLLCNWKNKVEGIKWCGSIGLGSAWWCSRLTPDLASWTGRQWAVVFAAPEAVGSPRRCVNSEEGRWVRIF